MKKSKVEPRKHKSYQWNPLYCNAQLIYFKAIMLCWKLADKKEQKNYCELCIAGNPHAFLRVIFVDFSNFFFYSEVILDIENWFFFWLNMVFSINAIRLKFDYFWITNWKIAQHGWRNEQYPNSGTENRYHSGWFCSIALCSYIQPIPFPFLFSNWK